MKCSPDMFTLWYWGGKSPRPTSFCKSGEHPPSSKKKFLLRPQRGESQRINCRRPGSSSSALRRPWSPSPSLARSGKLEPGKIVQIYSPPQNHLIWCRQSRVPVRLVLIFRGIFLATDVAGSEKADASHPELCVLSELN